MVQRAHVAEGVRMSRVRALRLVVALAGLAAVGLFASSALATSSSSARSLTTLNRQVLAAINRFRTSQGLVALRDSRALDRAALAHSLEMGRRGYFGHDSADGQVFWKRIQRYYRSSNVGENLLWAAPTVSAGKAMQLWIASPPHLENLKTARWRQVGVSAVTVANAAGVYGGRRVTIITTDFGAK
jgi:uncharacterized protein YkwD